MLCPRVRHHGSLVGAPDELYAALETFYAVIACLFENGSLGCVRLSGEQAVGGS
jgi:hypothetical protein